MTQSQRERGERGNRRQHEADLDPSEDLIGRQPGAEQERGHSDHPTESDERVASEAADLLYHLMVGLGLRDLGFRSVVAELARRAGIPPPSGTACA